MRNFYPKDLEDINQWREGHGANIIPDELYPPNGLFEPDIAAAFINFTDTKIAFIENVVVNPKADKEVRKKTVMQMIEKLENLAYDRGVKYIVAVTTHPAIEKYVYWSKGEKIPAYLYGKELHGSR